MKLLTIFLGLLTFILSCDKGIKTPEGLLTRYIEDVTSSKLDKNALKDYTTGKLWDSVKDLEADDFKSFLLKNKVKNPKIKVLNKNCIGAKCILTYVITYQTGKDYSFNSEVKKLATIENIENEGWRISDVSNIKTYFEAQKPLEVQKKSE